MPCHSTRGPAALVASAFAVVAVVAGSPAPAAAQAGDPFEIPTPGETLGGQAVDALNAVRDGRIAIGQLSRQIETARDAFWTLYPDGPGLDRVAAEYAELLWTKDTHYMVQRLVAGPERPFQPAEGAEFMRAMNLLVGELDGGIDDMAEPEFGGWVSAIRDRAGPAPGFPRLREAFLESMPAYEAYRAIRDRAEYFRGPASPLRSDDPRTYLIAVIMRGSADRPSVQEGEHLYHVLETAVGAEALGRAVRGVRSQRTAPDNFHLVHEVNVGQPRAVRPEPELQRWLHSAGDGVGYLHDEDDPRRWIHGWVEAAQRHDRLVAEHGRDRVRRAAALVARSRPTWSPVNRRFQLEDYQALGLQTSLPNRALAHLAALPEAELARLEAAAAARAAGAARATEGLVVRRSHTAPAFLLESAGLAGGAPLIQAATPAMMGAPGTDTTTTTGLRLVRPDPAGDGMTVALEALDGYRVSTPRLGSDGALYGALVTTAHGSPHTRGALYRIGLDGRGFRVLRSLEPGEAEEPRGRYPRVHVVDRHGTLFGTLYAGNRSIDGRVFEVPLTAIFRIDPDGRGLAVIADLPERNPALRPQDATARQLTTLVDGDDGWLYAVVVERDPPTRFYPNGQHTAIALRIRKDGGGHEEIRRFPTSTSSGHYGLAIVAGPGPDGPIFGALGRVRDGSGLYTYGEVFRMGRDGSDYTTLHRFQREKYLTWGIALGDDGMLYGLAGTNINDPAATQEIFRIDPREPGRIRLFNEPSPGSRALVPGDGELFAISGLNQLHRLGLPAGR